MTSCLASACFSSIPGIFSPQISGTLGGAPRCDPLIHLALQSKTYGWESLCVRFVGSRPDLIHLVRAGSGPRALSAPAVSITLFTQDARRPEHLCGASSTPSALSTTVTALMSLWRMFARLAAPGRPASVHRWGIACPRHHDSE